MAERLPASVPVPAKSGEHEIDSFVHARLADEHDVIVISDEIHAPLTFKGKNFIPMLNLGPDAESVTVTVTAASKGWNIAGLKCAIGSVNCGSDVGAAWK